MDDLISRKAVRLALSEVDMPKSVIETEFYDVMSNVADKLITVPSVDAVPVVHGKWEYIPSDGKFRAILICSKCKKCVGEYDRYKFCPNCGAKMDLEE